MAGLDQVPAGDLDQDRRCRDRRTAVSQSLLAARTGGLALGGRNGGSDWFLGEGLG